MQTRLPRFVAVAALAAASTLAPGPAQAAATATLNNGVLTVSYSTAANLNVRYQDWDDTWSVSSTPAITSLPGCTP